MMIRELPYHLFEHYGHGDVWWWNLAPELRDALKGDKSIAALLKSHNQAYQADIDKNSPK